MPRRRKRKGASLLSPDQAQLVQQLLLCLGLSSGASAAEGPENLKTLGQYFSGTFIPDIPGAEDATDAGQRREALSLFLAKQLINNSWTEDDVQKRVNGFV